MTERFCRDCVHRRRVRHWTEYIMYPIASFTDGRRWTCHRREQEMSQGPVDPVTGERERLRYTPPSCNLERQYDCGGQGRFWKPRDTRRHLFTMMKDVDK